MESPTPHPNQPKTLLQDWPSALLQYVLSHPDAGSCLCNLTPHCAADGGFPHARVSTCMSLVPMAAEWCGSRLSRTRNKVLYTTIFHPGMHLGLLRCFWGRPCLGPQGVVGTEQLWEGKGRRVPMVAVTLVCQSIPKPRAGKRDGSRGLKIRDTPYPG